MPCPEKRDCLAAELGANEVRVALRDMGVAGAGEVGSDMSP